MDSQRNLERMVDAITDTIKDRNLNDVVQLLTTMLLTTAVLGGIKKDDLCEFVFGSIEATYKQLEVPHGTSFH